MAKIARFALVAALAFLALQCHSKCSRWSYQGAREFALKKNLYDMRQAIDNFYRDNHRYPHKLAELVPKYLRRIPPDPITRRNDTWVEVGEPGEVNDVLSSAPGISCDGTEYSKL